MKFLKNPQKNQSDVTCSIVTLFNVTENKTKKEKLTLALTAPHSAEPMQGYQE